MKNQILIFIFLLIIPFHAFSQKSKKILKEFNNLVEKYPDFTSDKEAAKQFQSGIRVINKSIAKVENKTVKAYLEILVAEKHLKVERFLIDVEKKLKWSDPVELKHIKTSLIKLAISKDKYSSKRIVTDGISKNDRKKIGNPNSGDIWKMFGSTLPEIIKTYDKYLFDKLTPNKTLVQFQKFIQYGIYNSNKNLYNTHVPSALKEFYTEYTSDGEFSTLTSFNEIYIKGNSSWTYLFNKHLKSIFQKDEKNATSAGKILISNPPLGRYIDIITSYPAKEVAFIALQKIIKKDFPNYTNTIKTIEKYEPLFKGSNLKKIKALKKVIINHQEDYANLIPIEEWNSISDDIQFSFNKDFSHTLLIPLKGSKPPRIFIDSNNQWILKKYNQHKNNSKHYFFWFNQEKEKQKNEVVRLSKVADLNISKLREKAFKEIRDYGYNPFVTDFYISQRHKVAFFVSNSPKYREDINLETNEFVSPGAIAPNLRFQEYKKTKRNHGKEYGNPNTDIYYSTYENGTWQSPKILLQLNTPFSERCPILSEDDGTTLFFSSEGHAGLGGFDAFKVDISKVGRKISVEMSSLTNIASVNSPYDELFYQQNKKGEFLSTNRPKDNGQIDFDIYKVGNSTPISPPHLAKHTFKLGKLNFELICDTLPERRVLPPNTIQVTGRITDENGNFFPRATIVFTTIETQLIDNLNYAKTPRDSIYQLLIRDDTKYLVQVFGFSATGDTISAYTEKYISVCDNTEKDKIVVKDWPLKKVLNLQTENYFAKLPFFFNTNKSEINDIMNTQMLFNYYNQFIQEFQKNPNAVFILRGFADKTGPAGYNCCLSYKRAAAVKRIFIQKGFPADRLIISGGGETPKYSGDNIDNYREYLKFQSGERNLETPEKIKLLLNRRVEVIFTTNELKDKKFNNCTCQN